MKDKLNSYGQNSIVSLFLCGVKTESQVLQGQLVQYDSSHLR